MLQHYIALGVIGGGATPTPTPMPSPDGAGFGSYSELCLAISAWLNRDDLTLRIPDFIRMAESRMTRLLRDPDQIIKTTVGLTSGTGDLPADFGQLIAFGVQGRRLSHVTPGEFGTYYSQNGDGRVYSVIGTTLSVLPSMGSAIVPIVYYRGIQRLSVANPTNWLLERAPDLYLYGALLQAEFFGWNDERLPLIKNAWDEGIAELRVDGENRRWGAAPLAPRLGRT